MGNPVVAGKRSFSAAAGFARREASLLFFAVSINLLLLRGGGVRFSSASFSSNFITFAQVLCSFFAIFSILSAVSLSSLTLYCLLFIFTFLSQKSGLVLLTLDGIYGIIGTIERVTSRYPNDITKFGGLQYGNRIERSQVIPCTGI